ncbi:MAG: SRPBCC family protein [Ktedonobacterales bacterium]
MATTAKTQILAEPGMPQIVSTREFDAPRDLVFRAHTDPDLLVQWLGPRRLTITIERFDVRDGGTWRYIHRDADGAEYGFHGVFHGTPSPDTGIIQTFEFEGAPGHVSLETLTLEERDGKTLVRVNDVFQSVEDRDAMIQSGMESGVNESMERLDELLARLASAR